MRELRIYGRALSPQEILAHWRPAGKFAAAAAPLSNPPVPLVTVPTSSIETSAVEYGAPFLSINGNKLIITGEVRQVYELQATHDLSIPWQPLITLTNRSGTVELIDEADGDGTSRFYRIKVLPSP